MPVGDQDAGHAHPLLHLIDRNPVEIEPVAPAAVAPQRETAAIADQHSIFFDAASDKSHVRPPNAYL